MKICAECKYYDIGTCVHKNAHAVNVVSGGCFLTCAEMRHIVSISKYLVFKEKVHRLCGIDGTFFVAKEVKEDVDM